MMAAIVRPVGATYGWYWGFDVLHSGGARVHLAHPLGVRGFRYRRVKMTCATPPIWPICCGWADCPRRGSPHPRRANCGSWCATAPLHAHTSWVKG